MEPLVAPVCVLTGAAVRAAEVCPLPLPVVLKRLTYQPWKGHAYLNKYGYVIQKTLLTINRQETSVYITGNRIQSFKSYTSLAGE